MNQQANTRGIALAAKHVAISGAGIGGLSLGIGLRRAGIRVSIFERAGEEDRGGSGLVLAPNGLKALGALGDDMASEVTNHGRVFGGSVEGHQGCFITGQGSVLAALSFDGMGEKWGAPLVSMLHARLHQILSQHAQKAGVEIHYDSRVTGFSQSESRVDLHVDGAASVSADLLVGADGLWSPTRKQLLTEDAPEYRGYTAVRGVGPIPKGYPFGFIAYGRGAVLFTSPVDEERVYWVASLATPQRTWSREDPGAARAAVLERLSDWDVTHDGHRRACGQPYRRLVPEPDDVGDDEIFGPRQAERGSVRVGTPFAKRIGIARSTVLRACIVMAEPLGSGHTPARAPHSHG